MIRVGLTCGKSLFKSMSDGFLPKRKVLPEEPVEIPNDGGTKRLERFEIDAFLGTGGIGSPSIQGANELFLQRVVVHLAQVYTDFDPGQQLVAAGRAPHTDSLSKVRFVLHPIEVHIEVIENLGGKLSLPGQRNQRRHHTTGAGGTVGLDVINVKDHENEANPYIRCAKGRSTAEDLNVDSARVLTSRSHKTTIRIVSKTTAAQSCDPSRQRSLVWDVDVQGMFNTRTCFGRFLFSARFCRCFTGGNKFVRKKPSGRSSGSSKATRDACRRRPRIEQPTGTENCVRASSGNS